MHLPLLRDDGQVGYVFGALDRIDDVTRDRARFEAESFNMIQVVDGVEPS